MMGRAFTYVIIGRSDDCDIVLDDPSVSARHARLHWEGDQIAVEDLGSANGTFVERCMIARALVRPGDELVIGQMPIVWSEPRLHAFLRAGPRRTTLRIDTVSARPISERRFMCGACRVQGLLPSDLECGPFACGACGAELALGNPPRNRKRNHRIGWLAASVLLVCLSVGSWMALSKTPAHRLRGRIAYAFGLMNPSQERTVSSREEASIRARIAPRIAASVDANHPRTRNLAVQLAADDDGPFHVEQVARVWAHVRRQWRYVSDPLGAEYFARASETIENGLAGDCDDFATVVIAMLQAIGGRGRMVMVEGDEGGHAYAEVCIHASAADVAARLSVFYRNASPTIQVAEIHYRSDDTCPVWLNLDWNARMPGGEYGRERWAVAIDANGATETLTAATGDNEIALSPDVLPSTSSDDR
jgi:transglutaminase-like putative cysteine protease